MPLEDMIKTLSLFGFSGIYLDSYGYEDGGAKMLSNITQILGVKPIISDNKRLYFFDMTRYNQQVGSNLSEYKKIYEKLGPGWHGIENWTGIQGSWMQTEAAFWAISSSNRSAILSMQALSFYRNRTMEIASNDGFVAQVAVPTSFVDISVHIPLAKGVNTLRLHVPEGCERPCDKPELNNPDSRCLSIAVKSLTMV